MHINISMLFCLILFSELGDTEGNNPLQLSSSDHVTVISNNEVISTSRGSSVTEVSGSDAMSGGGSTGSTPQSYENKSVYNKI